MRWPGQLAVILLAVLAVWYLTAPTPTRQCIVEIAAQSIDSVTGMKSIMPAECVLEVMAP